MDKVEFIKSDNKKLSMSRLCIAVLILAYITWGTVYLIQTGKVLDVPPALAGLITTLYGLNKFGTKTQVETKKEA